MKPLIDAAMELAKGEWSSAERGTATRRVEVLQWVIEITQKNIWPTTSAHARREVRAARKNGVEQMAKEFKAFPCGPAHISWSHSECVGYSGTLVARIKTTLSRKTS